MLYTAIHDLTSGRCDSLFDEVASLGHNPEAIGKYEILGILTARGKYRLQPYGPYAIWSQRRWPVGPSA